MSEVKERKQNKPAKIDYDHNIILFNDDHNSFEFVIACLVKYCHPDKPLQSEQCALIAHNTGKCAVKNGSISDLVSINQSLIDCGLNSEIQ